MIEFITVVAALLVAIRIVAAMREKDGLYQYRHTGDVNALIYTPLWKLLKGFTEWLLLVTAVCFFVVFADLTR
jgi:hypothetical protein